MKSLIEYFLPGGAFTAVQTADNVAGLTAVVPDPGIVKSVVINVHTVIDATTTFDVLVNGADSGVDVTLPDETPDETGVEMLLPAILAVALGDALQLRSNGEQSAPTAADITWVIRRS